MANTSSCICLDTGLYKYFADRVLYLCSIWTTADYLSLVGSIPELTRGKSVCLGHKGNWRQLEQFRILNWLHIILEVNNLCVSING